MEDDSFPCIDLSSQSPHSSEDALYAYNFDNIDHLSSYLGIPWKRFKDIPFAFSTSYIGFHWDLQFHMVSLSSQKRLKYSLSIKEWSLHSKHFLSDIQKLYGRLLHTCLVVPSGRAYLLGLEAMLRLCSP
jgi:hypothetical protein